MSLTQDQRDELDRFDQYTARLGLDPSAPRRERIRKVFTPSNPQSQGARKSFPDLATYNDKYERPAIFGSGGEIDKGFERGGFSGVLKMTFKGAQSAAADILGMEEARDRANQGYLEAQKHYSDNASYYSASSLEGPIDDPMGFLTWVSGGAAELAPNMAVTLGSGATVGLTRSAIANMSPRAFLRYASRIRTPSGTQLYNQSRVDSLVRQHGLDRTANIVRSNLDELKNLGKGLGVNLQNQSIYQKLPEFGRGFRQGTIGSSMAFNTGEIYGGIAADPEVNQQNVTKAERLGYGITLGVVAGWLDALNVNRLSKAVFGKFTNRKSVKEAMMRAATMTVESMGIEAFTESLQETLGYMGKLLADEHMTFDHALWKEIVIEAGALGAIGGFGMGGGASALSQGAGVMQGLYERGAQEAENEAVADLDSFDESDPEAFPDLSTDPSAVSSDSEKKEQIHRNYLTFLGITDKIRTQGRESLTDFEKQQLETWQDILVNDDDYGPFASAALGTEWTWSGFSPPEGEDATPRVKVTPTGDGFSPGKPVMVHSAEDTIDSKYKVARLPIDGSVKSLQVLDEDFNTTLQEPYKYLNKGVHLIYTENLERVALLDPSRVTSQGVVRIDENTDQKTDEQTELGKENPQGFVQKLQRSILEGWGVDADAVVAESLIPGSAAQLAVRQVLDLNSSDENTIKGSIRFPSVPTMTARVLTQETAFDEMADRATVVETSKIRHLLPQGADQSKTLILVSSDRVKSAKKRGKKQFVNKNSVFFVNPSNPKDIYEVDKSAARDVFFPPTDPSVLQEIERKILADYSNALREDIQAGFVKVDFESQTITKRKLAEGEVRLSDKFAEDRRLGKKHHKTLDSRFLEENQQGGDVALKIDQLARMPKGMARTMLETMFPGDEMAPVRKAAAESLRLNVSDLTTGYEDLIPQMPSESQVKFQKEQVDAVTNVSEFIQEHLKQVKEATPVEAAQLYIDNRETIEKELISLDIQSALALYLNANEQWNKFLAEAQSENLDGSTFKTGEFQGVYVAALESVVSTLDDSILFLNKPETAAYKIHLEWLTRTKETAVLLTDEEVKTYQEAGLNLQQVDASGNTIPPRKTEGMQLVENLDRANQALKAATETQEALAIRVDLERQINDLQNRLQRSKYEYMVNLRNSIISQGSNWRTLLEKGDPERGIKPLIESSQDEAANRPNFFMWLSKNDAAGLSKIQHEVFVENILRGEIARAATLLTVSDTTSVATVFDVDSLFSKLIVTPLAESYWTNEYYSRYQSILKNFSQRVTSDEVLSQHKETLTSFLNYVEDGKTKGFLIDVQDAAISGRLAHTIERVNLAIQELESKVRDSGHFGKGELNTILRKYQQGSPLTQGELKKIKGFSLSEETVIGEIPEDKREDFRKLLKSFYEVSDEDVARKLEGTAISNFLSPMDLLKALYQQINFLNTMSKSDMGNTALYSDVGVGITDPSFLTALVHNLNEETLRGKLTTEAGDLKVQQRVAVGRRGVTDDLYSVRSLSVSNTAVLVKEKEGGYRLMTVYQAGEAKDTGVYQPNQAEAAAKVAAILRQWADSGVIEVPPSLRDKITATSLQSLIKKIAEDHSDSRMAAVTGLLSRWSTTNAPENYNDFFYLGMMSFDMSQMEQGERDVYETLLKEKYLDYRSLQRARDQLLYDIDEQGVRREKAQDYSIETVEYEFRPTIRPARGAEIKYIEDIVDPKQKEEVLKRAALDESDWRHLKVYETPVVINGVRSQAYVSKPQAIEGVTSYVDSSQDGLILSSLDAIRQEDLNLDEEGKVVDGSSALISQVIKDNENFTAELAAELDNFSKGPMFRGGRGIGKGLTGYPVLSEANEDPMFGAILNRTISDIRDVFDWRDGEGARNLEAVRNYGSSLRQAFARIDQDNVEFGIDRDIAPASLYKELALDTAKSGRVAGFLVNFFSQYNPDAKGLSEASGTPKVLLDMGLMEKVSRSSTKARLTKAGWDLFLGAFSSMASDPVASRGVSELTLEIVNAKRSLASLESKLSGLRSKIAEESSPFKQVLDDVDSTEAQQNQADESLSNINTEYEEQLSSLAQEIADKQKEVTSFENTKRDKNESDGRLGSATTKAGQILEFIPLVQSEFKVLARSIKSYYSKQLLANYLKSAKEENHGQVREDENYKQKRIKKDHTIPDKVQKLVEKNRKINPYFSTSFEWRKKQEAIPVSPLSIFKEARAVVQRLQRGERFKSHVEPLTGNVGRATWVGGYSPLLTDYEIPTLEASDMTEGETAEYYEESYREIIRTLSRAVNSDLIALRTDDTFKKSDSPFNPLLHRESFDILDSNKNPFIIKYGQQEGGFYLRDLFKLVGYDPNLAGITSGNQRTGYGLLSRVNSIGEVQAFYTFTDPVSNLNSSLSKHQVDTLLTSDRLGFAALPVTKADHVDAVTELMSGSDRFEDQPNYISGSQLQNGRSVAPNLLKALKQLSSWITLIDSSDTQRTPDGRARAATTDADMASEKEILTALLTIPKSKTALSAVNLGSEKYKSAKQLNTHIVEQLLSTQTDGRTGSISHFWQYQDAKGLKRQSMLDIVGVDKQYTSAQIAIRLAEALGMFDDYGELGHKARDNSPLGYAIRQFFLSSNKLVTDSVWDNAYKSYPEKVNIPNDFELSENWADLSRDLLMYLDKEYLSRGKSLPKNFSRNKVRYQLNPEITQKGEVSKRGKGLPIFIDQDTIRLSQNFELGLYLEARIKTRPSAVKAGFATGIDGLKVDQIAKDLETLIQEKTKERKELVRDKGRRIFFSRRFPDQKDENLTSVQQIEDRIKEVDKELWEATTEATRHSGSNLLRWARRTGDIGKRRLTVDSSRGTSRFGELDPETQSNLDSVEIEASVDSQGSDPFEELVTQSFSEVSKYIEAARKAATGDLDPREGSAVKGVLIPDKIKIELLDHLERSGVFSNVDLSIEDVKKEVSRYFSPVEGILPDGSITNRYTTGYGAIVKAAVRIFSRTNKQWRTDRSFLLQLENPSTGGVLTNPVIRNFAPLLKETKEQFTNLFANAAYKARESSKVSGNLRTKALGVLQISDDSANALNPQQFENLIRDKLIASARGSSSNLPSITHLASSIYLLRPDKFIDTPVSDSDKGWSETMNKDLRSSVEILQTEKEQIEAKLKANDYTSETDRNTGENRLRIVKQELTGALQKIKSNENIVDARERHSYSGPLPSPVLAALQVLDKSLAPRLEADVRSYLKWNYREPITGDNFYVGGFYDDLEVNPDFLTDKSTTNGGISAARTKTAFGQNLSADGMYRSYEGEEAEFLAEGDRLPSWVPESWLTQNKPDLEQIQWDVVTNLDLDSAIAAGELDGSETERKSWADSQAPFHSTVKRVVSDIDSRDRGKLMTPVFITPEGTIYQGGPYEGIGSKREHMTVAKWLMKTMERDYGIDPIKAGFLTPMSYVDWRANSKLIPDADVNTDFVEGNFVFDKNGNPISDSATTLSEEDFQKISPNVAKLMDVEALTAPIAIAKGGKSARMVYRGTINVQSNSGPNSNELIKIDQGFSRSNAESLAVYNETMAKLRRGEEVYLDSKTVGYRGEVVHIPAEGIHSEVKHLFTAAEETSVLVVDWKRMAQTGFFEGNAYKDGNDVYFKSNLMPTTYIQEKPTIQGQPQPSPANVPATVSIPGFGAFGKDTQQVDTTINLANPADPAKVIVPLISVNFELVDSKEVMQNYISELAPLYRMEAQVLSSIQKEDMSAEQIFELENQLGDINKAIFKAQTTEGNAGRVAGLLEKRAAIEDSLSGRDSQVAKSKEDMSAEKRKSVEISESFNEIVQAQKQSDQAGANSAERLFLKEFQNNFGSYLMSLFEGTREYSGSAVPDFKSGMFVGSLSLNKSIDSLLDYQAWAAENPEVANEQDRTRINTAILQITALARDYNLTGSKNGDALYSLLSTLNSLRNRVMFDQVLPGVTLQSPNIEAVVKSYINKISGLSHFKAKATENQGQRVKAMWTQGLKSIPIERLTQLLMSLQGDLSLDFSDIVIGEIDKQYNRSKGPNGPQFKVDMMVKGSTKGGTKDLGLRAWGGGHKTTEPDGTTSRYLLVTGRQPGVVTPDSLISPKKRGEVASLFMHLGNETSGIEEIAQNALSLKVEIPALELPSYLAEIDQADMWTESNKKELDQKLTEYGKLVAQSVNQTVAAYTSNKIGTPITIFSEETFGFTGGFDGTPATIQFAISPMAEFGTELSPEATANITGGRRFPATGRVSALADFDTVIPDEGGILRVSGPVKQGNARELLDAYLASSPQGTDYSRFVAGLFRRIDDLLTFGDDQGSFFSGIPVVTLPDVRAQSAGAVLSIPNTGKHKGLVKLFSDSSDKIYNSSPGMFYKLGMYLNRRHMSDGDLITHELQHSLTTLLGDAKLVERGQWKASGSNMNLRAAYTNQSNFLGDAEAKASFKKVEKVWLAAGEKLWGSRQKWGNEIFSLQEFASRVLSDPEFVQELNAFDGVLTAEERGIVWKFVDALLNFLRVVMGIDKGSLADDAALSVMEYVHEGVRNTVANRFTNKSSPINNLIPTPGVVELQSSGSGVPQPIESDQTWYEFYEEHIAKEGKLGPNFQTNWGREALMEMEVSEEHLDAYAQLFEANGVSIIPRDRANARKIQIGQLAREPIQDTLSNLVHKDDKRDMVKALVEKGNSLREARSLVEEQLTKNSILMPGGVVELQSSNFEDAFDAPSISLDRSASVVTVAKNRKVFQELSDMADEVKIPLNLFLDTLKLTGKNDPRNIINNELESNPNIESGAFLGKLSEANNDETLRLLQDFYQKLGEKLTKRRNQIEFENDDKKVELEELTQDQALIYTEGFKDANQLVGSIKNRVRRVLKLKEGQAMEKALEQAFKLNSVDIDNLSEELDMEFYPAMERELVKLRDTNIAYGYFQAISELDIDWKNDGVNTIKQKIKDGVTGVPEHDNKLIKLNSKENRPLRSLLVAFIKRQSDLIRLFKLRAERSQKKIQKFQQRVAALSNGFEDADTALRDLNEDLSKGNLEESSKVIRDYLDRGTKIRSLRKITQSNDAFQELFTKSQDMLQKKLDEYNSKMGLMAEYDLLNSDGDMGYYMSLYPERVPDGEKPRVWDSEQKKYVPLPTSLDLRNERLTRLREGSEGKELLPTLIQVRMTSKDKEYRKKFLDDVRANEKWLHLNKHLEKTAIYARIDAQHDKLKHLLLRHEHNEVRGSAVLNMFEPVVNTLRRSGTPYGDELTRMLLKLQNDLLVHTPTVKKWAGQWGKQMRKTLEAAGYRYKGDSFEKEVLRPIIIGANRQSGINSFEDLVVWSRKFTSPVIAKLNGDRGLYQKFEKELINLLKVEDKIGRGWDTMRTGMGLSVERKGNFYIDPISGLKSVFQGRAVRKGLVTSPTRLARILMSNDFTLLTENLEDGRATRSSTFTSMLEDGPTEKDEMDLLNLGRAMANGQSDHLITPEIFDILIKPIFEEFSHLRPFGDIMFHSTIIEGSDGETEIPVSLFLGNQLGKFGPLNALRIHSVKDLYDQMVGSDAVVEVKDPDGSVMGLEWNDGVNSARVGQFLRVLARLTEQNSPTLGSSEGLVSMEERLAKNVLKQIKNQFNILKELSQNYNKSTDSNRFNPGVGHFIMDARTHPRIPERYMDVAPHDETGMQNSLQKLAITAAFGRDADEAEGLFVKMQKQLDMRLAHMEQASPDPMNDVKLRKYKSFVSRIKHSKSMLEALFNGMNGSSYNEFQDLPGWQEGISLAVQGTLAGPRSMLIQLQGITDLPFIFSGTNADIAKNAGPTGAALKAAGKGLLQDILKQFGVSLSFFNDQEDYMKKLIMQSEFEALNWDEYNAETGFRNAYEKGISFHGFNFQRVARSVSKYLNKGEGLNVNPFSSTHPFKLRVPLSNGFKVFSKLTAFGASVGVLRMHDHYVKLAMDYFRKNPQNMEDPNFFFLEDERAMGKAYGRQKDVKSTARTFLVKSHEYTGSTIEDEARKRLNKPNSSPLDERLLSGLVMMANNEITGEGGMNTRPAWTRHNAAGKTASPILGWSLWKTGKLAEVARIEGNPLGANQANFEKRFGAHVPLPQVLQFSKNLAILGGLFSWAWASFFDEFDEEIRGVEPWKPSGVTRSAIAKLDRSGSLGLWGSLANFVGNYTDPKMSMGKGLFLERIWIASQLTNLVTGVRGMIMQEGFDADAITRTLPGFGGARQYVQITNNLVTKMGFDAPVPSMAANQLRTNAKRYLKSVGEELGIETKGTGTYAPPTPASFRVNQMYQAAMLDDPEMFHKAYQMALKKSYESYSKHMPDAEAYKRAIDYVKSSWAYRKPFNAPFKRTLSQADVMLVLQHLPDEQREAVIDAQLLWEKYKSYLQ